MYNFPKTIIIIEKFPTHSTIYIVVVGYRHKIISTQKNTNKYIFYDFQIFFLIIIIIINCKIFDHSNPQYYKQCLRNILQNVFIKYKTSHKLVQHTHRNVKMHYQC